MRIRLYDGMAGNGITGAGRRLDLREDQGVRRVRVRRVALDLLRAAGLRVVLAQAALPGGVLRGAAQRAADGLLLAAVADPRREAARHRDPQAVAGRLARRSPRWSRATARRSAPASTRRSRPSGSGCRRCARSATELAEAIVADRDARRAVHLDGRPRPAGRAVRRPGRGAGDRRARSTVSAARAATRCGARARRPPPGRASSTSPPSTRPRPPTLPAMTEPEQLIADMWATVDDPRHLPHRADPPPARRARHRHRPRAARARRTAPGCTIGGVVTHRQRPATARGVTFLNLEDETGMVNVIVEEIGVAAAPAGRARVGRPAHPRHARAHPRRRDQRAGRAHRAPAPRPAHPIPRLPVTASPLRAVRVSRHGDRGRRSRRRRAGAVRRRRAVRCPTSAPAGCPTSSSCTSRPSASSTTSRPARARPTNWTINVYRGC